MSDLDLLQRDPIRFDTRTATGAASLAAYLTLCLGKELYVISKRSETSPFQHLTVVPDLISMRLTADGIEILLRDIAGPAEFAVAGAIELRHS
jgi:hypothetical protein